MNKNNKFIPVSTDGKFTLMAEAPIYKIYKTHNGYIKNVKTNENCGQQIALRKSLLPHTRRLSLLINDEDCYEIIVEE